MRHIHLLILEIPCPTYMVELGIFQLGDALRKVKMLGIFIMALLYIYTLLHQHWQ